MSIPKLKFPRNYIIEIVPASYQNHARRILIDGIPMNSLTAPNSPDDARIQAGTSVSGVVSPMVQLGAPMGGFTIGGSSTPLPIAGSSNTPAGATTPNPPAGAGTPNLSPGSSTPIPPIGGTASPLPVEGASIPVVLDQPAEIDENNVVGKENGF